MIHIDGSQGEGGGQVLRTSLSLAILTGQDLLISGIRANRSNPGLAAQHLTAARAAAKICGGRLEGAARGSTELTFFPGEVRPGRYQFDIPTAGAATLVLQTIFVPLSMAGGASSLTITGGTHVPRSPCYHYLDLAWLPAMGEIGFDAGLALEKAGFYPAGGGRISTRIRPPGGLRPLELTQRGELVRIRGISAVANLDQSIAERQRRQARLRIGTKIETEISLTVMPSPGKGTMLFLLAEFDHTRACFFSLGERGKPAERVADDAVDALEAYLQTGGAVDPYLADQLLLPLCMAGGVSRLSTSRITRHLLTNADVIRSYLPASIQIDGLEGEPGTVSIRPG
ncbi:MAG TPA: RNA 3'-terminal phosphate cyclase [Anaerolineales bacterium]|nr:RNA 3'-terminal phosphate cyclase [Anaerolineales bacterium]